MSPEAPPPTARVGWGFDAHALTDEPPVILGGVVVSDTTGVAATSDGDVLAHAVIDAVLGACVLGDLGEHFPSDDPALADADSMFLLRQSATMAVAAGFLIAHIDVTVVAENVRVAPHRSAIVASVSEALGVSPESISVKATTTDGLGFIGRDEGIAAMAVATVTPL
jgi:2-C-methyl-D-erythritol 2,4-cyclodiphosphate synthase